MQNIRNKEVEFIGECCLNYDLFKYVPQEIQNSIYKDIESGIYDYSIKLAYTMNIVSDTNKFVELYSTSAYNVKCNLDIYHTINKNRLKNKYYVIKRLLNYAISIKYPKMKEYLPIYIPYDLAFMSSYELNPTINQDQVDLLNFRKKQKLKIKFSVMHLCAQCGERKTNEVEKQVRSSDEGGTLFIQCLNCGNQWTQRS